MNISIDYVEAQGFLPFKDKIRLTFSEYDNQLVLILGKNEDDDLAISNGSGKSALLDALLYGLFGKTPRTLPYEDDIIHQDCDRAEVAISLWLDTAWYGVIRGRKRNQGGFLILLSTDGEELLTDADNKTRQDFLEKILGFNYQNFSTSVVLPQNFVAFPELKPAQRAKMLSEVGDLDKWLDWSDKAKSTAKQADEDLNQIYPSLNSQEQVKEVLYDQLDDFKTKREEFEENKLNRFTKEKANFRRIKIQHQDALNKISQEITEIEQNLNTDREAAEKLAYDLEQIGEIDLTPIMDRKFELEKSISEKRGEILFTEGEIKTREKEIERMKKLGVGECPTCRQEVTSDHLKLCILHLREKQDSDTERVLTLREKNNAAIAASEALVTGLMQELDQKKQLQKKKENLIAEKSALDRGITNFTTSLENLTKKKDREKENFVKEGALHAKNLKEIGEEVNPFDALITDQLIAIDQTLEKIKFLTNKANSFQETRTLYNCLADTFKQIRMGLFDKMLIKLEELSQDYLSRYSSELFIQITNQRQTKAGKIKDEIFISTENLKGPVSFASFSGGEKQKVNLAVSLGMAQMIKELCDREIDLLFLDEPNNALDDLGKESNFAVFKDLAKNNKVFIIDHDAFFQDSFDQVLTITKKDGSARLSTPQ